MHAVMFCCLKVVNLFKRLCQIVNRNNVWLWDFTYILRNLVLDLPSVVLNRDDFFYVLPSHDINDLKVSKLRPLLKAAHWTFSREWSRKPKYIQKKYWNWLLATLAFFKHFRKTVSAYVLNRVVNMSLFLVITLSWQMSLSFRKQSTDLLSKSMDWFLYDKDLRHERDKGKLKFFLTVVFCSQIWQQIFFVEHFRLFSVYFVFCFLRTAFLSNLIVGTSSWIQFI